MKKVMPLPKNGPDPASLDVIYSQLKSYHNYINQNSSNSIANNDIRVASQSLSKQVMNDPFNGCDINNKPSDSSSIFSYLKRLDDIKNEQGPFPSTYPKSLCEQFEEYSDSLPFKSRSNSRGKCQGVRLDSIPEEHVDDHAKPYVFQVCEQYQRHPLSMPEDGNCLYHALLNQVPGHLSVLQLRIHIAASVRNMPMGYFLARGEDQMLVAKTIETDGQWAGRVGDLAAHLVMEYMANQVQAPVIVIDTQHDSCITVDPQALLPNASPIVIIYNGENHYDGTGNGVLPIDVNHPYKPWSSSQIQQKMIGLSDEIDPLPEQPLPKKVTGRRLFKALSRLSVHDQQRAMAHLLNDESLDRGANPLGVFTFKSATQLFIALLMDYADSSDVSSEKERGMIRAYARDLERQSGLHDAGLTEALKFEKEKAMSASLFHEVMSLPKDCSANFESGWKCRGVGHSVMVQFRSRSEDSDLDFNIFDMQTHKSLGFYTVKRETFKRKGEEAIRRLIHHQLYLADSSDAARAIIQEEVPHYLEAEPKRYIVVAAIELQKGGYCTFRSKLGPLLLSPHFSLAKFERHCFVTMESFVAQKKRRGWARISSRLDMEREKQLGDSSVSSGSEPMDCGSDGASSPISAMDLRDKENNVPHRSYPRRSKRRWPGFHNGRQDQQRPRRRPRRHNGPLRYNDFDLYRQAWPSLPAHPSSARPS